MLRLPLRMEEVLLLVHGKGLREVDVAEKLGVSKQAVNKALREGIGRLSQIFLTLAEILNADIIRVNLNKGYAIFRGRQLNNRIYAFYIPKKGVRILFGDNINCRNRDMKTLCLEIIEASKEWGIIKEEMQDVNKTLREVIKSIET